MKLCNIGHNYDYETEKTVRLFLPFEKIEILHNICTDDCLAVCELKISDGNSTAVSYVLLDGKRCERSCEVLSNDKRAEETALATALFECFVKLTEYKPAWGILTGIRPAKLYSRFLSEMGQSKTDEYFSEVFKVDSDKISLCKSAVEGENKIISLSKPNSFSLYLSVPFCPSRCSYCSFVSHSVDKAKELIPTYVKLLCDELKITAKIANDLGLKLETVYMGGGTPTTLDATQLDTVLSTVNSYFDMSALKEFTVEAGRPDTITEDKLKAIKSNGVTRISINPQTLNDGVLEKIGRKHTSIQTIDAFLLARKCGFDNINMDTIAGLPDDTLESFSDTIEKLITLNPESITVHSLSMKRASTLTKNGERPEISAGITASKMVNYARKRLIESGILPYYMYRQSKTVGNLENVGYAKSGFEGLYNVYIMDETHTVLACGASAVTKLKEPLGDNIERIFNFKYPYEYIGRFNEQISRKDGIAEFYDKYFK